MPKICLNGISLGNIKGILFDKDGTLSDSEYHLTNIAKSRINESLKIFKNNSSQEELIKLKFSLESVYGFRNDFLNPNGAIAIASRYENLISTATVFCIMGKAWSEALELANNVFLIVDKNKAFKNPHATILRPLLPGVKELLEKLQKANLKCALISNDTNKGIEDFITVNKLESKFIAYWSCENSPKKPNPNAVKGLCKLIKIDPSECALIGDSDSDLKMAKDAGIGIRMGYISGWNIKPNLSYQQELISKWDDLSFHLET